MTNSTRRLSTGGLILCAMGLPISAADAKPQNQTQAEASPPQAADGAEPPDATPASAPQTESDIVVTAQRRAERLQDVPVSVQAALGQTLATRNITGLTSIGSIAPSVQVSIGAGRGANLYIRGVGSGRNQSFDQSVGIYIDSVYHGRSRTTSGAFLDLDRIEILKGPQSLFFGNNSIAGAFNITSNRPGKTWSGWSRGLISPGGTSGRQFALEGAVGGPITDKLGIRVAATYNGQHGWLENVNTGRLVPNDENIGARVTLSYDPTSSFSSTLKVEGGRNISRGAFALQDVNCPPPAPYVTSGFCSVALATDVPIGLRNNSYSINDGAGTRLTSGEAVWTNNLSLDAVDLSAITAYYGYKFDFRIDTDGTPVNLFGADLPEKFHQFSQEIRLTSSTGKPIEYMLGVYYQHGDLASETQFNYSFLNPTISGNSLYSALVPYLPLGQSILANQIEDTYSAFASLGWNLSDSFKISGGLRASWVHKDFDWRLIYGRATTTFGDIVPLPTSLGLLPAGLGLGSPGKLALARTDHALMPSVRAQYNLDRDVMVYASYSRGFKAGGFNFADNTANPVNYPFNPEHVNAYELGLKGEFWNRRLTFNMTAFRSDYSDLQVTINSVSPSGTYIGVVRNAARSRAQGVEMETRLAATDWFRLGAAITYLDSKYLNYPNAGPTTAQTLAGIRVQDLSGHVTPFAPKWSGNVTGRLTAPIGGGYRLVSELTALFRTKFDTGLIDDPVHRNGGYTRVDGQITLESPDGKWNFDIIGKNLTNRTILIYSDPLARSLGSQLQQKEQPRNVAFQIRHRW